MSMNQLNEILSKLSGIQNIDIPVDRDEYEQQKADFYNISEGNLNDIDGFNCELCKNKGFIAKYENGYQVLSECKCKKTRATLNRAKKSGLGDILKDFTFDKFIANEEWQKANKEKAQEFCKDENAKWFCIGGQVGSGKSHLCTAISGHYIKAGYELYYMIWVEESKKLKALITDFKEYQKMIDKYKNVDVLYIDDFLKVRNGESPTTADINLAFEILNHRLLDSNKITIISSEKTLKELILYDEATMSRIYKQTGNYKINIDKDINKNYRFKE